MRYLCVVAVQETLVDLARPDPAAPLRRSQAVTARLTVGRGPNGELHVHDSGGGQTGVQALHAAARKGARVLAGAVGAAERSWNLNGGTLSLTPASATDEALAWPGFFWDLKWESAQPPANTPLVARGSPPTPPWLILDPLVFTLDDENPTERERLLGLLSSPDIFDRALVLPPVPLGPPDPGCLDLYGPLASAIRDQVLNRMADQTETGDRPAWVDALRLARDPFVRDFLRESARLWFADNWPESGRRLRLRVPRGTVNDYRQRFVAADFATPSWRRALGEKLLGTVHGARSQGDLEIVSSDTAPFAAVPRVPLTMFGDGERPTMPVTDVAAGKIVAAAIRSNAEARWRSAAPTSWDFVQRISPSVGGPLLAPWSELALEVARCRVPHGPDDPDVPEVYTGLAAIVFGPILCGFLGGAREYLGGGASLCAFWRILTQQVADAPPELHPAITELLAGSDRVNASEVGWVLLGSEALGGRQVLLPPHTGWPQVTALVHLLCPLAVAVRPAACVWVDAVRWDTPEVVELFGCDGLLREFPDAVGVLG